MAKNIHGDIYDYSKTKYISANNNVIITCKTHGDFEQLPRVHLRPTGCFRCNPKKFSKTQIEWLNFISILQKISIQHAVNGIEFTIPSTKYKADGYCKENNTIYEFHGDLWHGNPKIFNSNGTSFFGVKYGELYQNTLQREQLIRDLGYNLVVMWEHDWKTINKSIKILQRKFRSNH
jgi:G:T-mismatch repair DNA endonuclease (very short patch repair protein)